MLSMYPAHVVSLSNAVYYCKELSCIWIFIEGHLSMINGKEPEATELRKRFSAPDVTEEQICELVKEFVQ